MIDCNRSGVASFTGTWIETFALDKADDIQLPPGYYVMWSGKYEYLERATARLKIVVPVTLMIIFLLLYLNFRR